jgi:hypothetical protein
MLLRLRTLVSVTKNRNYFVVQCYFESIPVDIHAEVRSIDHFRKNVPFVTHLWSSQPSLAFWYILRQIFGNCFSRLMYILLYLERLRPYSQPLWLGMSGSFESVHRIFSFYVYIWHVKFFGMGDLQWEKRFETGPQKFRNKYTGIHTENKPQHHKYRKKNSVVPNLIKLILYLIMHPVVTSKHKIFYILGIFYFSLACYRLTLKY